MNNLLHSVILSRLPIDTHSHGFVIAVQYTGSWIDGGSILINRNNI